MKKLSLLAQAADEGERLDRFIAHRGAIARMEARRLLDRGAVWVEGRRVKAASREIRAGQRVEVVLQEAGRQGPALDELPRERVLFEDAHLIAVDKPPGVAAQATMATDRGTLIDLVSKKVGRPVGLVHRLDLETSGVTVFGKSKAATSALAEAFREGTARKRYLAAAWGALPDTGTIDLALGPDPRRKGRYVARQDGVPAVTHYRVLARNGLLCGVELRPETGRTHQIRVHLSTAGAPIVADLLYGGPREVLVEAKEHRFERVLLHARALELAHPATGAPLVLEAPIPPDLALAFTLAGVP